MNLKELSGFLYQLKKSGALSGIILIISAFVAIILANSAAANTYFSFLQQPITVGFGEFVLSKPLLLWINDGLMAVFFFVIGLEIKREIIAGELSSWKKAAMPVFAGLGGMILPALIFTVFNFGKGSSNGWGIPMATDIAFSLGILALLGKRVPISLKIFLTAIAIADDLGAVLVIAFFYSSKIIVSNIAWGALFLGSMIVMNLAGVRNKLAYAIPGILGLWVAFLLSGVHATIAGILAALAIPANTRINKKEFKQGIVELANKIDNLVEENGSFLTNREQHVVADIKDVCEHYEPPLQSLEKSLHPWVMFLIMPVFALTNAGVVLNGNLFTLIATPASLGIILGLVLGKPLGILLFTWLTYKAGLASLPENVRWVHILGIGILGGVGFTMSLFISGLAFTETELINSSKIAILLASAIAGIVGYLLLRKTLR